MKKGKLVIILLVLAMITIVGHETYSYYISRMSVNVVSTSSRVICDAEIKNVTDSEKSKFGYTEFKVVVKNYDGADNLTKEPFSYKLNVVNNGGSNGVFGYNNTFDGDLEITDQFSNTEKDTKEYIIQVKTVNGMSDSFVGYKVRVNCTQTN